MRIFYEFYDEFLGQLLSDSQGVFPQLSMEVRMDGEYLYDKDGEPYYYQHLSTYNCGNAPYVAAMYGIPIGQVNNYEKLDVRTAMAGTVRALDAVSAHSNGKKLYLDQFLYMDNTPEYGFNAQLEEGLLPEYLVSMIPILRQKSMGYGIWVYQNYVNNVLYNPQFALHEKGWIFDSGCQVVERDGTLTAMIPAGGQITQKVNGRLTGDKTKIYVELYAECEKPCNINVFVGNQMKTVKADNANKYTLTFDNPGNGDLTIQSSGLVYVDNVKEYTYIQDGQLYSMDGQELSCIQAVRTMNALLN